MSESSDRERRSPGDPGETADVDRVAGDSTEAGDLTVIYAAATGAEANLLVNQLAELGIRAVVSNAVLEGGAGVDILGWPTLARVAVAAQDAQAARQLALEFDRTVSRRRTNAAREGVAEEDQPAGAVADSDAAPDWPRCPGCHTRRLTRCPICDTEGTDFRRADADFAGALGVADGATPLSTCGCGSGSCHKEDAPGQAVNEGEAASSPSHPAEPAEAGATPSRQTTLICSTCDEPFQPQYARRCGQCGHEFDEGFEVDVPAEPEHFDYRVVVLIAGVLAVVGGLLVYFATIVPGG